MELDQLFYSYPDQNDDNIQSILNSMEEFNELRTDPLPARPPPGGLFKYQLQGLRFMAQYDRMLGILGAGTGKTCYGIGAAENFRADMAASVATYITDYIKPTKTNIKTVYIITMSPTLVREIERQIICSCTAGKYYTEKIKKAETAKQQRRAARAEIKNYYSIHSIGKFSRDLVNYKGDEQKLIEKYSDSLFIFDEVHSIRNSPTEGADGLSINEISSTYAIMHRLFHIIERSKILLFTATPILDDYREFVPTMNLILPLDKQMKEQDDYLKWTVDDFAPYFNGYISYVRALPVGVDIEYIGDTITGNVESRDGSILTTSEGEARKYQTITYNSEMSKFQSISYLKNTLIKDSVHLSSRLAATFVFPDGSARDPSEKYIITKDNKKYFSDEFINNMNNKGGNLAEYSAKINELINILINDKRKSFVYYEFVAGAGIDSLSASLNTFQFEDTAGNVIQYEQLIPDNPVVVSPSQKPTYCATGTSESNNTILIDKKHRFAVIAGTVSGNIISNILQIFNSYENRYGEYLQFIIGSSETKTGINFSNVLDVHIISPPWNNASTYQAYSRAIRATSHSTLQEETGRNVTVRIYQHASLLDSAIAQSNGSNWTVDLDIYRNAELKEINNLYIFRMMKILSWDCLLNIARNIVTSRKDYSQECDYLKCQYRCYRQPQEIELLESEKQSYDVLYATEKIDEIKNWIIDQLKNKNQLTFNEIMSSGPWNNYSYVVRAASDLIDTVVLSPIGVIRYIVNDNDILYTQDILPSHHKTQPSESFYTNGLIGSISLPLSNIIKETLSIDVADWLNNMSSLISNIDKKEETVYAALDKLSFLERLAILEEVISRLLSGTGSDTENIIENRYIYYIMEIPDPTYRIQADIQKKNTLRIFAQAAEVDIPEDIPKIVLHTYYTTDNRGNKYNINQYLRSGPDIIRVYNQERWRSVSKEELPYYKEAITNYLENTYSDIFETDLYAYYIQDQKSLYIVDKLEKKESDEKRGSARVLGKKCTSFTIPSLYRHLRTLGYESPGETEEEENMEKIYTKLNNLKIDTDNLSNEDLQYYYNLSELNPSKSEICDILIDLFNEKQILIPA